MKTRYILLSQSLKSASIYPMGWQEHHVLSDSAGKVNSNLLHVGIALCSLLGVTVKFC